MTQQQIADTEHSALCRMIGNLFCIYAQALGVIGIETVNFAALLQSLLSRLLTGGKNASPCVSRSPSYPEQRARDQAFPTLP
jgi:hypothetical protein